MDATFKMMSTDLIDSIHQPFIYTYDFVLTTTTQYDAFFTDNFDNGKLMTLLFEIRASPGPAPISNS